MTIESTTAPAALREQDRPRPGLRLNNVTELRLIFAACVVVSHAVQLASNDQFRILRTVLNSEVAVQGFFILSGYLVFGSYERIRDMRIFFRRRLLRIYPAYCVAVLLFLALALAEAWLLQAPIVWRDLGPYLLANLTTLNFLKPSIGGVFASNAIPTINGALWSIKVELMFYFAVPLLFALARRWSFRAISALLVLAGALWWPLLVFTLSKVGIEPGLSWKFQLPGQLHFFGLGMALFARVRGKLSNIGLGCIVAWAIGLLLAFGDSRGAIQAAALVAFIGIVSTLPQGKDWMRGQDISYGIYLCHFPIIQIMLAAGIGSLAFGFYLAIVIGLAISYGLWSWNAIERPALNLGRGDLHK